MNDIIKVPNFNIQGFSTYKKRSSLSFRPSSTSLFDKAAQEGTTAEILEEKDMLNYTPPSYTDYDASIPIVYNRPVENLADTDWYQQKEHNLVQMFNTENKQNSVYVPSDLITFPTNYDVKNRLTLHWGSSEGYAHDNDKFISIEKGKSELIEHHSMMFWWFGKSSILELNNIRITEYNTLLSQKYVKAVKIYEILEGKAFGYHTIMVVLETYDYPKISVGFGANKDIKSAINHAILESVHSYQGDNWYALTTNPDSHTNFNHKFYQLVYNSRVDKYEKINRKHVDFYYSIINNDSGYTTKVYSPNLQTSIVNKYVPFYYPELLNEDNIKLRSEFKGIPFI